jgi:hypothetical protein
VEGVTSGTEQRRHAGCLRDHYISELVLLLPFALRKTLAGEDFCDGYSNKWTN